MSCQQNQQQCQPPAPPKCTPKCPSSPKCLPKSPTQCSPPVFSGCALTSGGCHGPISMPDVCLSSTPGCCLSHHRRRRSHRCRRQSSSCSDDGSAVQARGSGCGPSSGGGC